jgi:hypothetical protein
MLSITRFFKNNFYFYFTRKAKKKKVEKKKFEFLSAALSRNSSGELDVSFRCRIVLNLKVPIIRNRIIAIAVEN